MEVLAHEARMLSEAGHQVDAFSPPAHQCPWPEPRPHGHEGALKRRCVPCDRPPHPVSQPDVVHVHTPFPSALRWSCPTWRTSAPPCSRTTWGLPSALLTPTRSRGCSTTCWRVRRGGGSDGGTARRCYEQRYSPKVDLERLKEIYAGAVAIARVGGSAS